MKDKFIHYFMSVAELTSQLSYAKRLQVGSVIVKDDRIISCGYNGNPSGWDNSCEDSIFISNDQWLDLKSIDRSRYTYSKFGDKWIGLKTKDSVIHSEANALSRLSISTETGVNAVMFCTHSPCLSCSKLIYSSGIKTLYYKHEYRSSEGLTFLTHCNIEVIKI